MSLSVDANRIDEFFQDLTSNDSVERKKSLLDKLLQGLGIKSFTYHLLQIDGQGASRFPYVISTYPDDWRKHYFESGYLDDDPVVGEVLRRRLPFSWNGIADPVDLSRRQRKLLDEARMAGVSNGFTIPINAGNSKAALSLVPDGNEREAASLLSEHRHLFHLVALHFHASARAPLIETSMGPQRRRSRSLLSPREKEVLEWISKGKSSWEIAAILAISEKSIEFHIEGAKRKLQVANRTHAVVKALLLGLISFP